MYCFTVCNCALREGVHSCAVSGFVTAPSERGFAEREVSLAFSRKPKNSRSDFFPKNWVTCCTLTQADQSHRSVNIVSENRSIQIIVLKLNHGLNPKQ